MGSRASAPVQEKVFISLTSTATLSRAGFWISDDPLSAIVAQAAEQACIPAEECRLSLHKGDAAAAAQVWPLVDCGDIVTMRPGLQRCVGPGLVATAASLIAAGMPVRLLELVLKETCDMAVHAAPFTAFTSFFEETYLVASYNTPDGLPYGPRVRVTASARGGDGA